MDESDISDLRLWREQSSNTIHGILSLTIRTLSVPRTVFRNRTILSNKGVEGPNSFAMVRGLRAAADDFSDIAKRKRGACVSEPGIGTCTMIFLGLNCVD